MPLGPWVHSLQVSNAYMLVYVRKADWQQIMCDTSKTDIARHLLDRLEVRLVTHIAFGTRGARVQGLVAA